MIVYLHGLNSSAQSSKAQQTVAYCTARGVPCVAPTLHHRPSQARKQIEAMLAAAPAGDDRHTFVGSSMGGYFATYFCEQNPQWRAVLINPAVRLADKVQSLVGQTQTNYHSDETYVFSQAHLDEFAQMAVAKITHPSRYFLLAQQGDEVLDYREAVAFYDGGRQVVEDGGDHSFVGYTRHLPAIIAFATDTAATK